MSRVDEVKLEMFIVAELEELAMRVEKTIAVKREQEKRDLLGEMEKLAAQRGLTLAEVVGSQPKKGRVKAPQKYKNLESPGQTWSGRGKRPKWVEAHLTGGGKLEELAI